MKSFEKFTIYKPNSTDILLFGKADLRMVKVYFETQLIFRIFFFKNDCTITFPPRLLEASPPS